MAEAHDCGSVTTCSGYLGHNSSPHQRAPPRPARSSTPRPLARPLQSPSVPDTSRQYALPSSGVHASAASARDTDTGSSNVPVCRSETLLLDPTHIRTGHKMHRADFRRKVYGILLVQMLLTIVIAGGCMLVADIRHVMVDMAVSRSWLINLAMFIPSALSLVFLMLGGKDSYPINYVLLFVFTLCISIDIGYVCAVFHEAGLGHLILQAMSLTALIFFSLTAYAMLSGRNFSYLGGFLSTMLFGLVMTGFTGFFFPGLIDNLIYPAVGALTFSGYILFDTWRIEEKFSVDDYIPATIELYLDIVNLFLYILRILVILNGKRKKK